MEITNFQRAEITNHQPDWDGSHEQLEVCDDLWTIFGYSLAVIFFSPWYHSGRWSTLVDGWLVSLWSVEHAGITLVESADDFNSDF
jgi:hypothetical protein